MRSAFLLAAVIAVSGFVFWSTVRAQRGNAHDPMSPSVQAEPFAELVEAESATGVQSNVGRFLDASKVAEPQSELIAVATDSTTRSMGSEATSNSSLAVESDDRVAVQFLSADSEHLNVRWWRVDEEGDVQSEGRERIAGGFATSELEQGLYVAGLADSNFVGELVEFAVLDDALEVKLPEWSLFPVTFQIRDAYTDTPLPGATVSFQRAGAGSKFLDRMSQTKVSDAFGMIRFEDLAPSEWTISSACSGYVLEEHKIRLPGRWADELKTNGILDLKSFSMAPFTTVAFALVGGEPFEDLAAYSISHTHEGQKVHFNAEGYADLVLGWFNSPLYVKVWYPDGRAAVMYLENELPSEGEPHEIEIGGPRKLEVDLRFTEEVKELIKSEENGGLRVSFRPSSGDAKFVGVETKNEGVFTFDEVQAELAVVNFATASDGALPVDWKTLLVKLDPVGTTACSLIVDQRPLSLLFHDQNGAPVPDFTFELRQLPNVTSWLAGGVSGEGGRAPCVRVTGSRASLFGRIKGTTQRVAIDLPLEMDTAEETIRVDLGDLEPTFLAVQVQGRPRADVKFTLTGRDTGVAFLEVLSGEDGQTKPTELLRRSRVNAVLASEGFWMPAPAIEIQPGRNLVQVYEMGRIKLSDTEQLHRLVHELLQSSPASWLASGQLAQSAPGARFLEIPAGSYLIDQGQPTERRLQVSPGETIDSGL